MPVKTYSLKTSGNTNLSANFKVKEFACKDGSNSILISTELVTLLQKMRDHFNSPITINSAYRTPTYNKKIGGVANSQHTLGTAADIVVSGKTPKEVAQYAEFCLGNSGGIGLYTSFTHVDVRANKSRWNNTSGKEVVVSGFPGYIDPQSSTTSSASTSCIKIFIDPGHNYSSYDTGCQHNGLKEQDVTFDISNALKTYLEKSGFSVKLSRETKTTNLGTNLNSSLTKRSELANSWGADYFISIHCNANTNTSVRGTEVYLYSSTSKVKGLASQISANLSADINTSNRGVKYSTQLSVLKRTNMPAMLIETAFLSNVNDANELKNTEKVAKSIYKSICTHFNKPIVENSTVSSNTSTSTTSKPSPAKYHIEGTTHIVEIDPRNIWAVETQCATNKVEYNNFVNSVFFLNQANGIMYPQGIMVNAGKVLCNNATHGKPVSTIIIHDANNVEMKMVSDITKEKDVWFAVSGYGVYPKITATQEGFTGKYSDVLRGTNRPIIGYRKKDNKIVIAVRANSTAERANQTAANLGLNFAISLDGGGSTTLKVNGSYKFKGDGRKLYGGIIWA